ncbi:MAG: primosomal protein N' [Tannerella sp.]|jgi:primosomal protein N' (replication factor Y)|nr:primosomal protein N' [Tannerella sp.]
MKFAEVLLPLPLENTYTYRIPDEMLPFVQANDRVIVPFGKKHLYIAVVKQIHESVSGVTYEIKEIMEVLDSCPVINPRQMQFWEWIASYYLCKTGEVYKAAVPTGLISLEPDKKYVPRKETCIRLSAVCNDEEVIHAVFNSLKRAKQQERLLLNYVDLAQPFQPELSREVSKKELVKASGIHTSVLEGLIKRGILEYYEREVSRIQQSNIECKPPNPLTEDQQKAYVDIQASFQKRQVCLLHGVSMSGKTEIYIHVILEMLQNGSNVLCLLPEIGITKRMTERLAHFFGNRLLVYHSGISDNERVEIWNHVLCAQEPTVTIGVRSAVFLPFVNLGLVVVDEEHDASYRQQDPAPRFHARNAAIMLARMYGAKTLLVSATPSLESYYHALTGKYGFISLKSRYGVIPYPEIKIADIKDLKRRKIMKDTLFSPVLKEKMEEALKRNRQVVLFQNRRGFAEVMECRTCSHVVHCTHCDVCLTVHKYLNRLVCHYCGYSISLPVHCPVCGGKEIRLMGFGTEKVEAEIEMLFPGVQAKRLDMDTARTRGSYEHILTGFEAGKSKILIGTQMVAKGLECSQVGVAGILNADSLMNVPDFRAHERAFQLITQVCNLAGRSNRPGSVVIQTSRPDHPLIQAVRSFDYERMATDQLSERKMYRYPPYFRLIVLVLRCGNEQLLEQITNRYAEILYAELKERVLPPFTPPVARVQVLYVRQILLKLEINLPIEQVRSILDKANRQMQTQPGFSKIMLHYEVDN